MTALPVSALPVSLPARPQLRLVGGTDLVRPAAPVRVAPRWLRTALGWGLAAAIAIGAAGGVASALNEPVSASGITVTVATGDTLWSIAAEHTDSAAQTQEYVTALISLNDLDSATLQVGQALQLPELP